MLAIVPCIRREFDMRIAFPLLVASIGLPVIAQAEAQVADTWIWANAGPKRVRSASFRREFSTRFLGRGGFKSFGKPLKATLTGNADFCSLVTFVNGKRVARIDDYSTRFQFDVTEHVRDGRNFIGVAASSQSGPTAFSLRIELQFKSARSTVTTDDGWKWIQSPPKDWLKPGFNTKSWSNAKELGIVADEPFGDHPDTVTIRAADDYTQWKQAIGAKKGTDPKRFYTRPGFRLELLRSAKSNEGSWVGLTFDPKGRLIVAREDKGLLRFTLDRKTQRPVRVETINTTLRECRGLLFAHGALYAHANNSLGLYRLRDTNGDDRFDEVKLLRRTPGGKGHGRNDLALGPDGKIYAIHGDSVETPKGPHRFPAIDKETRAGRRGFVMRCDRDGKNPEVVVTGMRNPFGIDFNPDGEMFTYDADAEYDMGSSWYRPTRILHMTPGADFGWRAVTRSWPAYDPDTAEAAPPAFDIGKGSPTGVRFGTRSHFPGKYKQALYVLDWAYGRVLAVHMTPRGAGYAMRAETFLKGRPFNVTNLAFGPDGAMYLVTGGRKTQSGLYRVTFTGRKPNAKESTPQQRARGEYSKTARALRKRLEGMAGVRDGKALAFAWPFLNSPDPHLRYSSRRVIEHIPVGRWRNKAMNERKPIAALTALLSLAQAGDANDHIRIVQRLGDFPFRTLPIRQQLVALRIYEIGLRRSKSDAKEMTIAVSKHLDPLFPVESSNVNRRLATMLIRLNADKSVPRILSQYRKATTQRERFHYLYVLRNAANGWTPNSRKAYFTEIARMHNYLGGQGMPTFIAKIKADALSKVPQKDRPQFQALLAAKVPRVTLPAAAKNRKFVKDWKLADLLPTLDKPDRKPDFKQGQLMFHAAACSACHRVGNVGHLVGPDLTAVGRRFSRKNILEAIVEPSRVVAEQYRQDQIVTTAGKPFIGTILHRGDYRANTIEIQTDPLKPDSVVKLKKSEIVFQRKSKTSMMPKGLLSTLTKQDILDLLAYLESGGNPRHPVYRRQ